MLKSEAVALYHLRLGKGICEVAKVFCVEKCLHHLSIIWSVSLYDAKIMIFFYKCHLLHIKFRKKVCETAKLLLLL